MGKTLAQSEKDPDRRQPQGGFTTRPSRDTHPLADILTASPVCSCACTCVDHHRTSSSIQCLERHKGECDCMLPARNAQRGRERRADCTVSSNS